ncbi:MAG: sugar isomerase, partial [Povalibacter sp.]
MTTNPAVTFIDKRAIEESNASLRGHLESDYQRLGEVLARNDVQIDAITQAVGAFEVAIPSWGVGTGGTRFARFPAPGEPRSVFEKLEDCSVIHKLTGATPRVSLHFPWDRTEDVAALKA